MSMAWVHQAQSSCGNCRLLSPPNPNRWESEAATLQHVAPSSALLDSTVQTWLEDVDELPAACAGSRDQTQLCISVISGKSAVRVNQSYSLAEEGLGELLWSLSHRKLDEVIRKITSSIKNLQSSGIPGTQVDPRTSLPLCNWQS